MKCFDIVETRGGHETFVIFQSDFLSHLDTRLVVPLAPVGQGAERTTLRLNPKLTIGDDEFYLATHLCLAVNVSGLRSTGKSLEHERDQIRDAFDFLTTGF